MRIFFLSFILSFSTLLSANAQTRYYVDINANGTQTGQNWTDAFQNLHDALALSLPGDEIWVAQGTYKPAADNNRSAYFQLPSGVTLYGGFAGTEMLLEERDWASHPTVLSGDISTAGDTLDNSYNLLYLPYPDLNTIVDGFTFRDAVANSSTSSNGQLGYSGAALYIMGEDSTAYPAIRNCLFEHNTTIGDGGAVYVNGKGSGSTAPVFEHCIFRLNRAINFGGCVYKSGGSWLDRPADFDYCRFESNRARRGAVIYFIDSERSDTLDMQHSVLLKNVASQRGDGIAFGNLRNSGKNTSIHITTTEFNEQVKTGCIVFDLVFSSGNIELKMDSCLFIKNGIINTGAQFITISTFGRAEVKAINCSVLDCDQFYIYPEQQSTPTPALIIDNMIVKQSNVRISVSYMNIVMHKIQAINKKQFFIHNNAGQINIDNSTFIGHNNLRFEGISVGNLFSISNSTIINNLCPRVVPDFATIGIINNSILKNNTYLESGIAHPASTIICDQLTLAHSIVDSTFGLSTNMFGPGMLYNTDPLFIDSGNDDYHLQPCSPAINAGNNAIVAGAGILTDLDGNVRIQGGTVDMGAYEDHAVLTQITVPTATPTCIGQNSGSIAWNAADGCAPYTYTWTNAAGATGTGLTALSASTYTVTVSDSKNRTATAIVTVTSSNPRLLLTGDTVLCNGVTDGVLQVNINDGTEPITWVWSSGDSTPTIFGIMPGVYAATATDGAGCTAVDSVLVASAPPVAMSSTVTHATIGQSNGAITIVITSGQTPFAYIWNTGATTASIIDIPAGSYQLTLTDGAGCDHLYEFTVDGLVATDAPDLTEAGTVRPNPASTTVTVRFGTADAWQLYDATGRIVAAHESSNGVLQLDVSQLLAGVYFYQFLQHGRVQMSGGLLVKD